MTDEIDQNAADSVTRRNVLKTAGGALGGATLLAGQGAATGEGGLRFEVADATQEVIIARVTVPTSVEIPDNVELAQDTYLGVASQFIVREDAVRLPEDAPDVLATPVEVERLDSRTYRMSFRPGAIDWSETSGEQITLGLGLFHSHDITPPYFDVSPIPCITGVEITHPPNNGYVGYNGDTSWNGSNDTVPIGLEYAEITFKANTYSFPPECSNNLTLEWDYKLISKNNAGCGPQNWSNAGTGSPNTWKLFDCNKSPAVYKVRVQAVTNQGSVVASDTNQYSVNVSQS